MPIAKKDATKKESVAAHNHDDLLKEIDALKKELAAVKSESAALKGQCHSCCSDVSDLKKQLSSLKSAPAASKDARVDLLIDILKLNLVKGKPQAVAIKDSKKAEAILNSL